MNLESVRNAASSGSSGLTLSASCAMPSSETGAEQPLPYDGYADHATQSEMPHLDVKIVILLLKMNQQFHYTMTNLTVVTLNVALCF